MSDVVEGLLQVGLTDKQLNTVIVEQSNGTPAHNEVVVQGDKKRNIHTSLVGYQFGAETVYANAVYSHQLVTLIDLNAKILQEARIQTLILNKLIRTHLSAEDLPDYFTSKEG